jgi:mono/diheme cytochrome c family protein
MRGSLLTLSAVAGLLLLFNSSAVAMPWDVDMYRQQSLVPGEVARPPVKGTVPVGYKPWRMTTEEATKELKNPVKLSEFSLRKGKRLWSAHCLTCHGLRGEANGPVSQAMGVPNIINEFYAAKADGSIYGILMNGGSNMPRYGYKFSEEERWHLVNYVRHLQGKQLEK